MSGPAHAFGVAAKQIWLANLRARSYPGRLCMYLGLQLKSMTNQRIVTIGGFFILAALCWLAWPGNLRPRKPPDQAARLQGQAKSYVENDQDARSGANVPGGATKIYEKRLADKDQSDALLLLLVLRVPQ